MQQSCTAWVYHVYHSWPSEHRALVIKPRGEEHSRPLPVPGEDSKHFCPLHLGTGVASENPTQSGTGWTNALLTQRRGKARPATGLYISPLWLAGPSSFLWSWRRAVTYMYPSLLQQKDPNLKAGGVPEGHWCTCLSRARGHSLSKNRPILPYKVLSLAQAVWAPYYPFQAWGPVLCSRVGVGNTARVDCLSQQFCIEITWLCVFLPIRLWVPQGHWSDQCMLCSTSSLNVSWLKKGKEEWK